MMKIIWNSINSKSNFAPSLDGINGLNRTKRLDQDSQRGSKHARLLT